MKYLLIILLLLCGCANLGFEKRKITGSLSLKFSLKAVEDYEQMSDAQRAAELGYTIKY